MKQKIYIIFTFALLCFQAFGQTTSFNTSQFSPNNQKQSKSNDYYDLGKHNIEFNIGGLFHGNSEFFYYIFGVGYEFRMLDYLGFEIAFNSGKIFLQENTVSGVDENKKYEYLGNQYFNSKVNTFSMGPQLYLPLNKEKGFYLVAGVNLGLYTMHSTGRTESNTNVPISEDQIKFPSSFYSRLKVGTNINLSQQVILSAAISGDNVDFENSAKGINWSAPWAKELSPDHSVYLLISFIYNFQGN
jgi:hypothetical protein